MADSTVSRRTVIVVAGSTAVAAGLAACGSGTDAAPDTAASTAADAPTAAASTEASMAPAPSSATIIARVADVPVGTAYQFTNPTDGNPGYVMQPAAGTFVAYSAVCTHEGCIVNPDGPGFACPCHGATYDGSGTVTAGPAKRSLASIAVAVEGDNVVLA